MPSQLETIVSRALQRDRIARYATAAAFHDALAGFLASRKARHVGEKLATWMGELFGTHGPDAVLMRTTNEPALGAHTQSATRPSPAVRWGGVAAGDAPAPRSWLARLWPRPKSVIALTLSSVAVAAGVLAVVSSPGPRTEQVPTQVPIAASLVVSSDPHGAAILLDGEDTGRTTPAVLRQIEPGPHTIDLRLDDYKIWRDTFQLGHGAPSELHANLVLEEQTLRVTTRPSGALVTIDGHPSCTSPCSFSGLRRSARLVVRANKPGYRPAVLATRVGDVTPDLVLELDPAIQTDSDKSGATFFATLPTLSLRVLPWAFVSIDGGPPSDKPIAKQPLSPGAHQVRITNSELDIDVLCDVELAPGESVVLSPLDLRRSGAQCPTRP